MVYTDNNRWDYQDKAIEKIVLFCKDKSNTKGLIVIPTGGCQ